MAINVNPERVIRITQEKLSEAIARTALLEAALEESLDRESVLQESLDDAKSELELLKASG